MSKSELLEVYLEESSMQEKRIFACPLCQYRTDRRNNLKRHTATMHEQSTAILECCGNRFANKAALRHHTAAYHRHGYVCTICARVFCRRALLRRHHAVHSGYKEFTCNICDYATSHKSNLERHMKIHESGDKYSTSSPSSSGQSIFHDRSSPENDFYQSEESKKSYCVHPPSRDNNPILASLLSQPAPDGEVVQWIYHSPYDSYSSQILDSSSCSTSVANTPSSVQQTLSPEYRWNYDIFNQEPCSQDHNLTKTQPFENRAIPRESSGLPLRHAIDVILGVKEEPKQKTSIEFLYFGDEMSPEPSTSCVVTTASNHWSIGHLSSSMIHQQETKMNVNTSSMGREPFFDKAAEEQDIRPSCKHPWQMTDMYHPYLSDGRRPPADMEEFTYVPKKLRMSKRYQNLTFS